VGYAVETLAENVLGLREPTGELIATALPVYGLWFCLLVVAVGAAVMRSCSAAALLGNGLVGRYGVLVGVLLTSVLFGAIHATSRRGYGPSSGLLRPPALPGDGVPLWVPMLLIS